MNKFALGLSVALIAGFCILTSLLVTEVAILAPLRDVFAVAWGVLAVVLLAVAFHRKWKARRRPAPGSDLPPEEAAPDGGSVLHNPGYWGVVAALFAGISHFINPWEKLPAKARSPVESARTNVPPPPPPPTNAAPAPQPKRDPFEGLRALRLRGVSLQGTRSSAILDGYTYVLGEDVLGAKLIRITGDGVVLERDGQTLEIRMGR